MSEQVRFVGENLEAINDEYDFNSAEFIRQKLDDAEQRLTAAKVQANSLRGSQTQQPLAYEEIRLNSNVLNFWERKAAELILNVVVGSLIIEAKVPYAHWAFPLPREKK